MPKPNFFILGAPKCGTTSLAAWLAAHPRVFMSPEKEPHYFDTDHNDVQIKDLAVYEKLFEQADRCHVAIGEASVRYLHSAVAVANIEKYNPSARYIVCLRNPVEMAPSLHEQRYFNGWEHLADFEEAWPLNDERLSGIGVTRFCPEPKHLAYASVCSLGDQLERLLSQVPRERVHTVLVEDMKADPRAVYRHVLDFLDAPDDGRQEFPTLNTAKERRSRLLKQAMRTLGALRATYGPTETYGILKRLDRLNVKHRGRPPLSAEMCQTLQEYFREDVAKLGQILARDLSHWTEPRG